METDIKSICYFYYNQMSEEMRPVKKKQYKENADEVAVRAYGCINKVVQLALESPEPSTRRLGQEAAEAGKWLVKDRKTLKSLPVREYKKGQIVFYKHKAEIIKVHTDPGGGPPYYEVQLADGSIKQTVVERLDTL